MKKLLIITATPLLLMGCTNHGGGFGSGPFKFMDTGGAGEYTCEGIMPSAHYMYCETGEHPHMCECGS